MRLNTAFILNLTMLLTQQKWFQTAYKHGQVMVSCIFETF